MKFKKTIHPTSKKSTSTYLPRYFINSFFDHVGNTLYSSILIKYGIVWIPYSNNSFLVV